MLRRHPSSRSSTASSQSSSDSPAPREAAASGSTTSPDRPPAARDGVPDIRSPHAATQVSHDGTPTGAGGPGASDPLPHSR
jgi:hypothetical protein